MSLEADCMLADCRALARGITLSKATLDEKQFLLGRLTELQRSIGKWAGRLQTDMRKPALPRQEAIEAGPRGVPPIDIGRP
jgi:hypothetical protein